MTFKGLKNFSFLFLIISSIQLVSCKSELEKINIDDVEKHRAYQDTILNKVVDQNVKFETLKQLISEYKSLENESIINNSNYYYYLSRLYGQVSNFPMRGFWFDSIKNQILNVKDYSNFYDSAYIFAEKSLKLDENNIRSMYNLCSNLYIENGRYNVFNQKVPFSFLRNEQTGNNRINYIIDNALRFINLDTTSDKYFSRAICEIALHYQFKDQDFAKGFMFESKNSAKGLKLDRIDKLWEHIKNSDHVFIEFSKEVYNSDIKPNVILARQDLKEKEAIRKELQQVDQRIFDYEFKSWGNCVSLGFEEYIRFYRDGTYELGGIFLDADCNEERRRSDGKSTFRVINGSTILLKNFFKETGKDVRFKIEIDSFLGVKQLYLTAYMDNGQLSNDNMLRFSTPQLKD